MTDGLTTLLNSTVQQAVREALAAERSQQGGIGQRFLYSRKHAAEALDVHPDTVDRLRDEGHLEYVEGVGRGPLYTAESIRRFVESSKTSALSWRVAS